MIPRLLSAATLTLAAFAILGAPPASAPATAQVSADAIPFDAYLELLKARARAAIEHPQVLPMPLRAFPKLGGDVAKALNLHELCSCSCSSQAAIASVCPLANVTRPCCNELKSGSSQGASTMACYSCV